MHGSASLSLAIFFYAASCRLSSVADVSLCCLDWFTSFKVASDAKCKRDSTAVVHAVQPTSDLPY